MPLGDIADWWRMPRVDALRYADLIPVIRAQFIVAISEGVRLGMADLKEDTAAIAAWDRLIAQADSRPLFPPDPQAVQSEDEIVADFDRNLWLAQMVEAGIGVPASMLDRIDRDSG